MYYAPEMLVKERRELLVSRLQHLSLSREGQQRNYEAQSRTQEVLNQLPNIDQAQNAPQDSDRLLYDGTKVSASCMLCCAMLCCAMPCRDLRCRAGLVKLCAGMALSREPLRLQQWCMPMCHGRGFSLLALDHSA